MPWPCLQLPRTLRLVILLFRWVGILVPLCQHLTASDRPISAELFPLPINVRTPAAPLPDDLIAARIWSVSIPIGNDVHVRRYRAARRPFAFECVATNTEHAHLCMRSCRMSHHRWTLMLRSIKQIVFTLLCLLPLFLPLRAMASNLDILVAAGVLKLDENYCRNSLSTTPQKNVTEFAKILGGFTTIFKKLGIQGWTPTQCTANASGVMIREPAGSTDGFCTIDIELTELRINGKNVPVRSGGAAHYIRIEVRPEAAARPQCDYGGLWGRASSIGRWSDINR